MKNQEKRLLCFPSPWFQPAVRVRVRCRVCSVYPANRMNWKRSFWYCVIKIRHRFFQMNYPYLCFWYNHLVSEMLPLLPYCLLAALCQAVQFYGVDLAGNGNACQLVQRKAFGFVGGDAAADRFGDKTVFFRFQMIVALVQRDRVVGILR